MTRVDMRPPCCWYDGAGILQIPLIRWRTVAVLAVVVQARSNNFLPFVFFARPAPARWRVANCPRRRSNWVRKIFTNIWCIPRNSAPWPIGVIVWVGILLCLIFVARQLVSKFFPSIFLLGIYENMVVRLRNVGVVGN